MSSGSVRARRAEGTARAPRIPTSDDAFRLYDFAPAMYVLLSAAGLINDINETGCQMLGRPRQKLLGMPLRMWMADESRSDFLEHLRRCRTGEDVVESEMAMRAADGGTIRARFYSKRCVYQRHHVFATVVADLTEYVVLERARKAAEHQRDRAERERELARAGEAAKDRLIAMVSHELRNPLSPAMVAADIMASWAELPARARQLAAVIKRSVELEARLIDDLLDFARGSRDKLNLRRRSLDVHQVLLDAVNGCSTAADAKRIAITLDLGASTHASEADEGRLRQVFANILNNAIKFSPPGTAILVRTSNNGENAINVAIHDQGPGMDVETLSRLFKPFQQDQPGIRGGGLGLGLTISHQIIAAHGGRLRANSSGAGLGSTFEVELATCKPPQTAAAPVRHRTTPGANGQSTDRAARRRVLIVEDHQDNGALMSIFLTQHGYEVSLARTLRDGLKQLDRQWDVVLTDIGLSDGSGLDIARRARKLPTPPRMIALSGYGTTADITASYQAGFDEHLVKPVNLEELLAAMAGATATTWTDAGRVIRRKA
jgi:PAS domain S-box-containing protein